MAWAAFTAPLAVGVTAFAEVAREPAKFAEVVAHGLRTSLAVSAAAVRSDHAVSGPLARGAVDAIRQLRDHAEAVRVAEVERALRRLQHLDPADRERVVHLTKALMNKFLHEPTLELRAAAGNGTDRELAQAVRRLFRLTASSLESKEPDRS